MRSHTIVVVTLLGMQLARPALAQTAGWDFSRKTPAAKDTAVPKNVAAAKESLKHTAQVSHKRSGRTTESKPSLVHLSWSEPAAVSHGAMPIVRHQRVILQWSIAAADGVSTTRRKAESVTSAPTQSEPAPISTVAAARVVTIPAAALAASVPEPATSVAAPAEKPIAPREARPTGLEGLSDEWPKAIKVGVQYRGRVEEQRGSSITGGRDDGYYLNRIRLETTVDVAPWLNGFVQVQDAQTLGYNVAAQPTSLTGTLDLRQGYVEALWPSATGFGVRVGRQEISLGEQRLIGASDWGNTARSFDAVRVFVAQPGVRVDAFVSSVVVVAQNAFDRRKPGETLSGTYVSLSRLVPKGVVEPYLLARFQSSVAGELGKVGEGATYTFGGRAAGGLPRRFDYGVEVAAQRGHVATDTIDAWAGHYALGWTVVPSAMKPRLIVEFNNASGDGDPRDGRRETFDQLYPTNHTKYGIADQMDWRNMRDAMVGIELSPIAKLKLSTDAHRLFLATTADGLYSAPGTPKVLNRKAISRTVGTELDFQSVYAFSKELSLGAGVGALLTGDYLAQSTSTGTVWAPYLMWNIKF